MNMIHYFYLKDKCFHITDTSAGFVFLTRNTTKKLDIFCVNN